MEVIIEIILGAFVFLLWDILAFVYVFTTGDKTKAVKMKWWEFIICWPGFLTMIIFQPKVIFDKRFWYK